MLRSIYGYVHLVLRNFGKVMIARPKPRKGCDVHNRRWSEAQPPENRPITPQVPQGRDYMSSFHCLYWLIDNLAPAGLCLIRYSDP
jgi:hypothetical protein